MVPMEIFPFASYSWYLLHNITNIVWNTAHWCITNYNINSSRNVYWKIIIKGSRFESSAMEDFVLSFNRRTLISLMSQNIAICKADEANFVLYSSKSRTIAFAFKVTSWVHICVKFSPEALQAISIKMTKNENVCTTQLNINLSFYLESIIYQYV